MAKKVNVDLETQAQVVTLIATALTCAHLISGRNLSDEVDYVKHAADLFDRSCKLVLKKAGADEQEG